MLLFVTLIVIDTVILIDTCIGISIPDDSTFLPNLYGLPRAQKIAIKTILVVVEALDLGVCIFATVLRYTEYVKEASEAFYAHKLFIYSTVLLHLIHGIVFFDLYTGALAVIALSRFTVVLSLAVCLLLTTKRTPDRITASINCNLIRRSSLYPSVDSKDRHSLVSMRNQPERSLMAFVNRPSPTGSFKSSSRDDSNQQNP